jgi:hypothetical protein
LGLQSGTISQIQPTSGGTAPTKATRPKSFYQWSVVDVQKWLRRHCGDYYHLYSEAFLEQDITGRTIYYNYIPVMHQGGVRVIWVGIPCPRCLFNLGRLNNI